MGNQIEQLSDSMPLESWLASSRLIIFAELHLSQTASTLSEKYPRSNADLIVAACCIRYQKMLPEVEDLEHYPSRRREAFEWQKSRWLRSSKEATLRSQPLWEMRKGRIKSAQKQWSKIASLESSNKGRLFFQKTARSWAWRNEEGIVCVCTWPSNNCRYVRARSCEIRNQGARISGLSQKRPLPVDGNGRASFRQSFEELSSDLTCRISDLLRLNLSWW